MKKNFLLILLFFVSLSARIHAESGFVFGGNLGMFGQTKFDSRSSTYDNDSSAVSGTDTSDLKFDNDLGFKFQAGLKYSFNDKISLLGLLGYFNRTTDKKDGTRGKINSFDLSLMVQMHLLEGFHGRLGFNVPVLGTVTLDMDNETKMSLDGGELDASGNVGYDIGVSYELMDHFVVTVGYHITNMFVEEERKTGGDVYTVKFNAADSQIIIGFDYMIPLDFLN